MPGFASPSLTPKTLAVCTPLPLALRTAMIGIMGGTINIGPHSLWIAPGALTGSVTITATITSNDSINLIQFTPEGLKFAVPGLITMSYNNCMDKGTQSQAQVVYTSNDLLRILEFLPSIDNPMRKTATGMIRHFSRYAIAY